MTLTECFIQSSYQQISCAFRVRSPSKRKLVRKLDMTKRRPLLSIVPILSWVGLVRDTFLFLRGPWVLLHFTVDNKVIVSIRWPSIFFDSAEWFDGVGANYPCCKKEELPLFRCSRACCSSASSQNWNLFPCRLSRCWLTSSSNLSTLNKKFDHLILYI